MFELVALVGLMCQTGVWIGIRQAPVLIRNAYLSASVAMWLTLIWMYATGQV